MRFIMAAVIALLLMTVTGCGGSPPDRQGDVEPRGKVMPVVTVTKQSGPVTLTATAVAEAKQEANLSFGASGTITGLYAARGKTVVAGQLLAVLDMGTAESRALQELQLEDARREFENKKADLHKAQQLYASGIVSQSEVENLQREVDRAASGVARSMQNVSCTRLVAPFTGTVVEVNQQAGETFIPGRPLIRIVDLSEIKLTIDVPGDLLDQYEAGQAASVSREGRPAVQGKVTHISPVKDPGTGKYRVEVSVNNAGREWRGGMLAQVEVPRKLTTGIVLPLSCIGMDQDRRYVLALENGAARRRDVQVGQIIGDRIEIQAGLKEGEQVVSAGITYIVEGEKIIARENSDGKVL